MKILYAISQDILNCDPTRVKHHLLSNCFNNSCSRHRCRIKSDVESLKLKSSSKKITNEN